MSGLGASRRPDPPVDRTAGHHYETSNDFYRLWLDPSMTYSCAFFQDGDEDLESAQRAKLDLAFRKVGLRARDRLLDIGCGWGASVLHAAQAYGAQVVGLTLSQAQAHVAQERATGRRDIEVRLQGWETYHEPADHIVSFGAFEHFTSAKYDAFFERCRELLPSTGRLLLQTITVGRPSHSFKLLRFAHFLHTEVFFEAELPRPERIVEGARLAGLELLHVETLRQHYVRTIELWLDNLAAHRDAAIAITDAETYSRYVRYLAGSRDYHASGETNVYQFLFGIA